MSWQSIETAPMNRRIIVFGNDEMAMGWHDVIDGRWYYAPQGGLIKWTITHWMPLPEPPNE